MEWQPIESAPKDGTSIIIYPHTDGGDVGIASWINSVLGDTAGSWRSDYDREWPTHWMPLPLPPKE